MPAGGGAGGSATENINERELIFKFLFDMKNDLNALKEQVKAITGVQPMAAPMPPVPREDPLYMPQSMPVPGTVSIIPQGRTAHEDIDHTEEVEESLSLEEKEKEMIRKALAKHRNKRKNAAAELGISERTLYRKIKEYDIP